MTNILLLAEGTWGDNFPFVQIGKMLKSRGHQVTLLSHRNYADKISQAGFDLDSVINIEPFEEWIKAKNLPVSGLSKLMYQKEQIGWTYEIIKAHSTQPNSILVSHFGLHLPVQMALDKVDIPCLTVYTAPFFMLNTVILAEIWRGYGSALNEIRAGIGLPPVSDWHAWLASSTRQGIALWPEWFAAADSQWPAGVEQVGFVSNDDCRSLPPEIQEFLDDGEPPILINHGSSLPKKKNYFSVCADACKRLGRRALLVTQHDELVKDCGGDGIMHSRFLHFPSVLPHVAAVVHHGGIGTSGQAIAAGIPQLVMPFGSDRTDNANRLQRMGVAEFLPPIRWQPNEIAVSLRRITTSKVVKERCRFFSNLSYEIDPVEKASDVIENFAASNEEQFVLPLRPFGMEELTTQPISL